MWNGGIWVVFDEGVENGCESVDKKECGRENLKGRGNEFVGEKE